MWNINFTYKQQIHFDNTDKKNKNKKKPQNIKRFL